MEQKKPTPKKRTDAKDKTIAALTATNERLQKENESLKTIAQKQDALLNEYRHHHKLAKDLLKAKDDYITALLQRNLWHRIINKKHRIINEKTLCKTSQS